MKIYDLRNLMVRFTGEYLGGILAGLGLGIVIGWWTSGKNLYPFLAIVGFLLICIGASFARATQRKAER